MSAYKARPGDRMNVLVAYASKHGATEEIAEAIADELRAHGLDVDCLPADEVADPTPYDGVVLGSAIYMARWGRPARKFLSRHRDALAKRPLWFSSGPFSEDTDSAKAEPPRLAKHVEALGARDHVVFGGRVPLDPAGFVERSIADKTPPAQRDARDWQAIRAWAAGIAADLERS